MNLYVVVNNEGNPPAGGGYIPFDFNSSINDANSLGGNCVIISFFYKGL